MREACKLNNTTHVVTRELIEIRDIYPPTKIDLKNPWQIKKKITRDEVIVGKLMIPFFETFEYILPYWALDAAKILENGCDVPADMWDVTEENMPKKYEGGSVFLRKLHNDDFYLLCIKLFNSHGLSIGDEIELYWDPRSSSLMFKLLSQVRASWKCYYLFFSVSFQQFLQCLIQSLFLVLRRHSFTKKFPSKAEEEEACKLNNTPHVVTRKLIEIRDICPPPKINLENPWKIKKKITRDEVIVGKLMIPFFETCDVLVGVWDVTKENISKKYDSGSVFLRKFHNDDFYLSCIKLFNNRGLSVGDEIGLYWDPRSSNLMFKLLSQVHA
ncbi:hypothetical protein H5410_028712 [Solanum commersonii]|uniref:B3 domain-containing protein n=1 Tax=Solanum commersonii TaxID=4109 RepID=A0A9J5Z6X7_SOLCO|nr:hypothetical protein H5410_028712 [Solanum commersonii]